MTNDNATAAEAIAAVIEITEVAHADAWITNKAAVLGILLVILAFIFRTASRESGGWKKFYGIVPSILLCYFIPGLLSTLGIIGDPSGDLYFVASRFLLPTCLVLLCLAIDLPGIARLGPKLLILFFTATAGIILGGPFALWAISLIDPSVVGGEGPDEVWRGLSTVAGSWIGGGANMTAMKEVFEPSSDLFSAMVTVDVIVANIWMGFMLWMAGRARTFDRWLKADMTAMDDLQQRVEKLYAGKARIPSTSDLITICAVGFAVTGIAFLAAEHIAPWFEANHPWSARFSLTKMFFWLVVISTTVGLLLSAVPAARSLEHVGASKVATLFLYILVAVIGLEMDLTAIATYPWLFAVGLVWILFQGILLFGMAKIIKAPCFFIAVGSQANIGGAASAPIVASAFNPRLAPVGVLLAVLGYAVGTYGAWVCANLMQMVSTGS
ncbi:MAG: hypothetical protein CMJ39_09825 [Phycisphaerae bacterium]|nr:hypothetical protein [Phycisphaerae bacterium]